MVKNRLQCGRPGFDPWVGKISWRRERLPSPLFWPRESHELYSPGGCKESDTTEQLSLSLFTISVFSLEIICSDSMLSFNWDICVFIWRCRNSFCILNINFFSNMWFENIFPLCMWPFHSVDDFLCYVEAFSLHHFHLSTFAFVALLWV